MPFIGLHASQAAPYSPDPEIEHLLKHLDSRTALLLPPVNVEAGGLTAYDMDRHGPGQRDYCNKMVYAPDRETALYAGGNHQSPHRMNDVWEYHLASNTWRLLYTPDGGNAGEHKQAYFLTSRTLVKNPDAVLTEDQRARIDAYREWWKEHVAFNNGHLSTVHGGPIMPSHTWDAFCYDARAKRLIWGMGANPAAQLTTHAYFTGEPLAELEQRVDLRYTPMWMFDPARKRWKHHKADEPRPALRGMGATMAYLPDLGRTLWYVAAQNVSPHAYETWLFDGLTGTWTELKPNNGTPISTLAFKENVAPRAEQQTAYSPKHQKLVAVHKHDTFIYDLESNRWSKTVTDERIYGHDARSIFVYDEHADAFLLLFPPDGQGKKLQLAAYSIPTNRWERIEYDGPGPLEPKHGLYMGYYDPKHQVLVAQGRRTDRMWVYKHME